MSSDLIKIGTSGFSYRDWLGNFYPQFCPNIDFLRYYSTQFNVVELDVTFYRIPTEKNIERWKTCTPDNFIFAAKFPRTVTHEGTIESRVEDSQRFVEVMLKLGSKLGPLLLQFPYSFKPESTDILFTLIEKLPAGIQLSVEIRNRKWLTDKFYEYLAEKNISLCLIDHPWMPKLDICTADFQYIRFLGDHNNITDDFSYVRYDKDEELQFWSNLVQSRVQENKKVYAFFNNHFSGHAPTTANKFRSLMTLF